MRVERYAFLGNVAQLGKAEHLKSAAVGQDRAVPAGKLVQAAHIGNDLITGTQVEMIGVAQHDLCADFFQIMCRKPAFDRGSSGNVFGKQVSEPCRAQSGTRRGGLHPLF